MNTPFQGATRRNLLLGAGALGLAAPSIAHAQGQYRAEYKVSVVGNRPLPQPTAFPRTHLQPAATSGHGHGTHTDL